MTHVGTLRAEHAEQLASFTCAGPESPEWLLGVQRDIRLWTLKEVVERGSDALGAWSDTGELCAVIVWRVAGYPENWWQVDMLAVAVGYQRQGLARLLKSTVIREAQHEGMDRVSSKVHLENISMRSLNRALGGIEVPSGDPDYVMCLIIL